MQILIIAATEAEIAPFSASAHPADILVTGVGLPSAIYHLQKRMQQIEYDLVIQAGIAGAFNADMRLGQTLVVKQDCFADVGIEEKGNYTPIFETNLADKNETPFENGWLVNRSAYMDSIQLPKVKAITVNKVSDNETLKRQFIKQFNADIESMEGAALHYTCLQENMPFVQLRSVSNYVGERDKTKWKIKEAIENLNSELQQLIHQLTN